MSLSSSQASIAVFVVPMYWLNVASNDAGLDPVRLLMQSKKVVSAVVYWLLEVTAATRSVTMLLAEFHSRSASDSGVAVGVAVPVAVAVAVGVGVPVAVGVAVSVAVGDGVCVAVAVAVGDGV